MSHVGEKPPVAAFASATAFTFKVVLNSVGWWEER